MGRILGPDKMISAKDAEVGDLLVATDGEARATAIVLEFNEDRDPLLGMLEGDNEVPYLRRIGSDDICASYGAGWIIEPVERPSEGPGHFETGRRAGLLVLTRSGWVMNFATSYADQFGRFDWEWRDLATGSQIKRVDRGLVHDKWKLSASAEDRAHCDGPALLTYRAEFQNGRQE